MAINSFLSIFLPKDRIFFNLFEQGANNVTTMGHKLKHFVNEADAEKRAQIAKEIEDLEHVNDDLTHTIFQELGKNFITPFDREDIHHLATSLDDVADYIYASSKKMQFHGVSPNDQGIQKMADVIYQSVEEVGKALLQLREMKKPAKITECLVKINSMENHADDIFDMSIKTLFETENDFKELIKKREVYTVMEICTDKCEDVANAIETIIVKYA